MKKYTFTVIGAYENASWPFKVTVTVEAASLKEAREKAVKQVSWPPNSLDWEVWKVHRSPR